jgi:hypothetical protein
MEKNQSQVKHPCPCGSGLESEWQNDGRNIPLCRTCSKCHKEKMSKYDPKILGYYTEEDVGCPIEPEDYY